MNIPPAAPAAWRVANPAVRAPDTRGGLEGNAGRAAPDRPARALATGGASGACA